MIKNNQFFLKNFSNIVFFGSISENLVLINKKFNINTTVITSFDQSKLMNKKNINYIIFNNINTSCLKFLKLNFNFNKTLFIGASSRSLFKKDTIKLFKNNFINIHNTRLPLDAGGAGVSSLIMRQDRIANMCIHLMTEEIDGGPIIANEVSLYPKSCILPIDFNKHNHSLFIKFYESFIKNLHNGKKFNLKPQLKYLSRYNPRVNTEINGYIDWDLNSFDLINFINAFDDPYKGASTYLNRGNFGKLFIKKAQIHRGDSVSHPFMTGIVSRHDGNWIVVCTNSKSMLVIEEVINSKGKNIINLIKPGDRFFTPTNKIISGRSKRIMYNSKGLKK